MLNIFFKPSHIFTVMRPAHGRHFSIKSACCAAHYLYLRIGS